MTDVQLSLAQGMLQIQQLFCHMPHSVHRFHFPFGHLRLIAHPVPKSNTVSLQSQAMLLHI